MDQRTYDGRAERGIVVSVTEAGAKVASYDRPGIVTKPLKPLFLKPVQVGWPVFFMEFENGNGVIISHIDPGISRDEASEGPEGKSAYEVWIAAGNTGTVEDYLESLIGPAGLAGADGSPDTPEQVLEKLKTAGGIASNSNLLINANFINPVNQRGNPNYPPGDYGYDRWRLDGAGGTFRDGATLHIVATADTHAWFSQPVEHPELLSGTHIIAIYANGEGALHLGCTVNGTWQVTLYDMTGQGWRWYTHIVDLPDGMTSFTVSAVAIAGGHYWIKHAKLEKGSILTPFVPKQYGEELAACKRYYIPKHTAPLIYQSGSYYWACPGNLPVEMRVIPTVTSAKYGLIGSYEYPLVGTFSLDETGSLYVLTGTNLASGTTQDYYVVFEGLDAEIR